MSPATKIDASKYSQRLDLIRSVSNLVELLFLNKSLITVWDVECRAHFVNTTVLLLSAVTIISLFTILDGSKDSQRLDLILSVSNLRNCFVLENH